MGWSIDLKIDKPITEAVIDEVITELSDRLRLGFEKQRWGWSLAVDAILRNPQELRLSGSYGTSGQMAEGAAEAFAYRLEKRGFLVTWEKMK